MRRNYKVSFLALLAVLALSAIGSASASAALPEFKPEGGAAFPVAFTGAPVEGASTEFQTSRGAYSCRNATVTGQITGPKEVGKVFLTFGNGSCAASLGFCYQKTHPETWETTELKGRIAYISKKPLTVGLLLEPVTEPFASCTGGIPSFSKIQGSLIGTLAGLSGNKTFRLGYNQSSHVQEFKHFEGEEAIHNLRDNRGTGEENLETGVRSSLTLTVSKGSVHLEA